jgi:hypothetical protein
MFRHSGLQCLNSTKLHLLHNLVLGEFVTPITFDEVLTQTFEY